MKLILRNIGMLKEAELNLNGLTVIAGENDNGKSTVGKVIFCIIKAINRYKEDLEESKEHKIEELLNKSFFLARRNPMVGETFSSELRFLLDSDITLATKLERLNDFLSTLDQNINDHQLAKNDVNELISFLRAMSSEMQQIITTPEDTRKSIESALKKVFTSEFDSSILLHNAQEGSIELYDDSIKLININIKSENKVVLLDEFEPIEIKDATFIESPLILNNYDLLIRSKSGLDARRRNLNRMGIPYTTLHTKDLFDKLKDQSPLADLFMTESSHNLKDELKKIINGEIIYDDKDKNFIFVKDGEVIPIKNTASGIKTFGMIQVLVNNGYLDNNSLFIFDEPENHLHPKLQLKLAKILVTLVKNGVNIIVSSHSPYMIEALKRFSDADDLENKTNFYLAENGVIENHDRLENIFELLSQPFDEFRKMDEVSLRDE